MILITGAAGHLGNVLTRRLLAEGKQVRALVLPGESCESLEGLDVECVDGNILDISSLERAMQGVDVVFHLAGIVSILPGQEDLMVRVNVEGARNVAQTALKMGVRRMIHTSSIHAFERVPDGILISEQIPFAPDNPAGPYDRTKAMGTLEVLKVVQQGLDAVVVCPTGVIGPFDYLNSEMGQTILSYTHKHCHFLVKGAFDFVDVRDVAEGMLRACELGRTGEVYILSGTHIELSSIHNLVQDVARIQSTRIILPIKLALGMAAFLQPLYRMTGWTPRFTTYSLKTVCENSVIDFSKARQELGYRPRPIRSTIEDTVSWWHRHLDKALHA